MTALFPAFGLVFVAELGDKSMLIAMLLSHRYGAARVLIALSLEVAVVMALAVAFGGAADLLLSDRAVALVSGVVFIGFGLWTLRDRDGVEDPVDGTTGRSAVLVVGALALTLFVAELGDKTQIATLSLSSLDPGGRFGIWVGATTGMIAADAVAVLAGRRLLHLVSRRLLTVAAAVLFIAFGAGAIVFALR